MVAARPRHVTLRYGVSRPQHVIFADLLDATHPIHLPTSLAAREPGCEEQCSQRAQAQAQWTIASNSYDHDQLFTMRVRGCPIHPSVRTTA